MIKYHFPEGFEDCVIVHHGPHLYIEIPGARCAIDHKSLRALSPEDAKRIEQKLLEKLDKGIEIAHEPDLEQFTRDIIKARPHLRHTALSGFWDEVWHIMKTGKTKEETREMDKLKSYLHKNRQIEKDLAAVLKTSENFEKLIEENKEKFEKNPELFKHLADTIEIHPDLKESIRKEIAEGVDIKVEGLIRDLPGLSPTELSLPESELVYALKELFKHKGLRSGEDYKKITVESGGEGPRDRKMVIVTDTWGLTKFTRAYPKLELDKA